MDAYNAYSSILSKEKPPKQKAEKSKPFQKESGESKPKKKTVKKTTKTHPKNNKKKKGKNDEEGEEEVKLENENENKETEKEIEEDPVVKLVPQEMKTQSTQTEDIKEPQPTRNEPEHPTRIINVREADNVQESPELNRKETAVKEIQTENIPTRAIAVNTENVPAKTVELKNVETSTQDLDVPKATLVEKEIQTDQHQNDEKIENKIFVVSNSKTNTQSNRWRPLQLNGEYPPTPEGPRFLHNGTQLTYTHQGVQHDLLEQMHTYQTQGLMCDVFIRVGGIDFKAHKVVLAASSPYFSELFRNINKVRVDRLILEGLQPQSVAAMLGYFYMAKLIIDADDVENLLDSAYYFKTTEVVKLCTDYLELQLDLHNCFTFYQIAIRHNIEGLRMKTFRFICWNFKSIAKESRFLEASGDVLVEVVSSKEVKVKTEEEIYEGIWNWYKYNKTDRGLYIPKLVMQIHYELMELEYLQNKVKKELYLESELCRKKVDDAVNIIKNKIGSKELSDHRQASDNVYLFSHSPTKCELLDLVTGKFVPMKDLRPPPAMVDRYHITVKAGKVLYTVSNSKVSCFNPSKVNWEYFSKGTNIVESGICGTRGSIFVAGGKPDGKQFCELNLSTKEWIKHPDMEFDRRSPAIAAMGNTKPRIFVAGGFSLSKSCVLDTMEYFVVSDKVWKLIKLPMSVPRLKASMIVNTDKVYIVGGRSEEKTFNSIDIFQRTSQKWIKNNCNLSEPKVEPLLAIFEGKIYCLGGNECTSIEVLEEVESKRKWNMVAKLSEHKSNAQCIVYHPV